MANETNLQITFDETRLNIKSPEAFLSELEAPFAGTSTGGAIQPRHLHIMDQVIVQPSTLIRFNEATVRATLSPELGHYLSSQIISQLSPDIQLLYNRGVNLARLQEQLENAKTMWSDIEHTAPDLYNPSEVHAILTAISKIGEFKAEDTRHKEAVIQFQHARSEQIQNLAVSATMIWRVLRQVDEGRLNTSEARQILTADLQKGKEYNPSTTPIGMFIRGVFFFNTYSDLKALIPEAGDAAGPVFEGILRLQKVLFPHRTFVEEAIENTEIVGIVDEPEAVGAEDKGKEIENFVTKRSYSPQEPKLKLRRPSNERQLVNSEIYKILRYDVVVVQLLDHLYNRAIKPEVVSFEGEEIVIDYVTTDTIFEQVKAIREIEVLNDPANRKAFAGELRKKLESLIKQITEGEDLIFVAEEIEVDARHPVYKEKFHPSTMGKNTRNAWRIKRNSDENGKLARRIEFLKNKAIREGISPTLLTREEERSLDHFSPSTREITELAIELRGLRAWGDLWTDITNKVFSKPADGKYRHNALIELILRNEERLGLTSSEVAGNVDTNLIIDMLYAIGTEYIGFDRTERGLLFSYDRSTGGLEKLKQHLVRAQDTFTNEHDIATSNEAIELIKIIANFYHEMAESDMTKSQMQVAITKLIRIARIEERTSKLAREQEKKRQK